MGKGQLARLSSLRWLAKVGFSVLGRPDLWLTALDQGRRMAPTGWWRRVPFLPVPDQGYLAFRLQTMYGDAADQAAPSDLITWLEWCRQWRRSGFAR